ncbi:MAG: hypothetical protein WAM78_06085 [Candidatus Sulfotelmatobacter sp.]
MNSSKSLLRSGFALVTKNIEPNLLLFFVLSLSVVAASATQVNATRAEPAMQCADTSKRSQGDVIVNNTCNFKITVQTSTPGATQLVKSLDPGGSITIEGSAQSPWRVFTCTWPGAPADQAGKEVAYATEKYECAVKTASAQAEPSSSQPSDETKAEQEKLYGGAHPYMDEPLPELKKTVHELGGLKAVPLQEPLPDLLAKVGAKADELLHKVPDLISDEAVSQTSRSLDQGLIPGCVGTACFNVGTNSGRDQTFNYLILTHPTPDGQLSVQEYRTGGNGQPVQGAGAPNFQGFISSWIIFSSANQVESHFRYLGEQKTDGHNTFVIGFAQVPGSVESPGQIMTDSRSVPMFLQGVAWIDQSDFRIVRLRTDLLAPQPEVLIQRQTASILFGPVHIPTVDLTLWLPQVVHVEMESRGQLFQEQHKYSKYRLYQAKSKIILSPQ